MPEIPAKQSMTTRPPSAQSAKATADLPAKPGKLSPHDPQQIGPYRILENIGEGGMGLIYKAEQRHPVRRIVALKVIKLGMDTKQVIARFEAERQALAMISHPNVARVLDAGMTEAGRPYFAMEFVAGIPLTDYCDRRKLTVQERLELFIPICQAVQHAHQKGIIHRDLKPANVLVTLIDGKAVPKVIDFGIAKATNSQLTQQTLFTQTGAMVGTPEYMSPEQAKTSGLDVDTRTDVYSLGVILYELLTGTLPFDPDELRKAGIDGMARIIQDTEPHKPSTRITFLQNAPKPDSKCDEIAKKHRTDSKTLRRELRGDLDWIVLKAMEKDPARRYQTANALAADVRRYLDNEPIAARPPSTAYRFSKMVRRHKLAMASVLLIATALVVGLAGTVFELVRAQHERDVAMDARILAERAKAEAERAKTEAVSANDFMRDLVLSSEGSSEGADHLNEAVRKLDGGWLADEPIVAAGCRLMIARGLVAAQLPAQAEQQFNVAIREAKSIKSNQALRVTAMARYWLGNIKMGQRNYSEAASEFRSAATQFRGISGAETDTINAYDALSTALNFLNDAAAAQAAKHDALTARVALVSSQIIQRPREAALFTQRAFLRLHLGQYPDALDDLERGSILDPNSVFDPYYAAIVKLFLNRDDEYRRAATQIYQKFGRREDRQTAGRVLMICALSPTPVVDSKQLSNLIEVVSQNDGNRIGLRWFWMSLALGEYRAGHYARAQQWAARPQATQGQYTMVLVDLISAMSMQRTANPAARDAFRRVNQRINEFPRIEFVSRGGIGPADYLNTSDYLLCLILRREANEVFGIKPASRPAR